MRDKNSVKNFDLVARAARIHGRDKIARTIIRKSRGFTEWAAIESRGNVRKMVLDIRGFEAAIGQRHTTYFSNLLGQSLDMRAPRKMCEDARGGFHRMRGDMGNLGAEV